MYIIKGELARGAEEIEGSRMNPRLRTEPRRKAVATHYDGGSAGRARLGGSRTVRFHRVKFEIRIRDPSPFIKEALGY